MVDSLRIEALMHRCAACSRRLEDGDMIASAYIKEDVAHFDKQVELGIVGADVRVMWVHLDCQKPSRVEWRMNPDLQTCIRCNMKIGMKDVVQPCFQVTDPDARSSTDPTDRGIALNERIYFVHADCKNPGLDKRSTHILLKP